MLVASVVRTACSRCMSISCCWANCSFSMWTLSCCSRTLQQLGHSSSSLDLLGVFGPFTEKQPNILPRDLFPELVLDPQERPARGTASLEYTDWNGSILGAHEIKATRQ